MMHAYIQPLPLRSSSPHPAHHPDDMDTCTYDVVGGAYEVIKKSTAGGVSGEVTGAEEFSLSKCEAYGPVSSSSALKGVDSNTEYEVIRSTSHV